MSASFRFHGELGEFLPRGRRGRRFDYACARAATLKNAIEALGVPHTEVGKLVVNEESATLQRIVREGDAVEIFPADANCDSDPEFIAEVAARYRLAERARPFTLCLRCNLPLERVEKAAVAARLPEKVLELHHQFTHCAGCDRVYWPGSHWDRMRELLRSVLTGL